MAFRNDPFDEMNRFVDYARRSMWDDFGMSDRDTGPALAPRTAQRWSGIDTNIDVEETDDGYVVRVDLPGFETDDLSIRFEDGVLSVRGETDVAEETSHGARRRSRWVDERLSFPTSVVESEITASYHNGVLEVTLPTEDDASADDTHRIDIE